MKRVRLHLESGGVHPVYRLLTTSPHVERAAGIHWNVTDSGALTMVHRVIGDFDEITKRLEGIDQVTEYEVFGVDGSEERDGREAYIYLRDDGTDDSRQLFQALSSDGLVTVPPIEYDETGATFTVIGTERALQRAHESVPDRFEIAVERVGDPTPAIDSMSALSDRQHEAARVGVELGYFDVPRRASHDDVARALGCSPSTAAEHLQKAQAKLVRAAFEE